MNLTILEKDCKSQARKCFENFKHYLVHYPFTGEVDVQGTIEYTVLNEFDRAVLKKHMSANLSKIQIQLICDIINKYKIIIIQTCWVWSKKNMFLSHN